MKRMIAIVSALAVLALLAVMSVPVLAQAQFVVPTVAIVSVDPGKTVTVKTANYPANDTFDVYMNYYGTLGIGGTKVATVDSGAGGALNFTFNIPDFLKNEKLVAIRLQSTKSGYYSFNWFTNQTAGIPNTGNPGQVPAGTIPTISIVSVDPGKTVTIQTQNYPANDNFDVLMGKIGSAGVGGTKVQTIASGLGGTQNFTFNIPDALKNERQIAIRLQSPTTGYFSYNWFWNTTTTGGIPNTGNPGQVPAGTIPTISIVSVDPGKTVKIQTSNYPANDNFEVFMGKIGTRGVGGTKVDTVSSGGGGTLTYIFNIPDALKNDPQIAIRLQSPVTGYFSYNWFSNTTTTGGIPNTGNPGSIPAGTVPTISIQGVVQNGTVTVQTANYPTNDTFDVYMGDFGTKGVGGVKVTSVSSGTGGTQTFTFNIPDSLKGKDRIAIRLQSPATGYFSYNWFWNSNAP